MSTIKGYTVIMSVLFCFIFFVTKYNVMNVRESNSHPRNITPRAATIDARILH